MPICSADSMDPLHVNSYKTLCILTTLALQWVCCQSPLTLDQPLIPFFPVTCTHLLLIYNPLLTICEEILNVNSMKE